MVVFNAYQCEVRKCTFNIEAGASSDGGIGIGADSSCLYIDNIWSGVWDTLLYGNGGTINAVIAYNYGGETAYWTNFHNVHPSLNLFEGNCMTGHQSDGYHGSSSHQTFFRNWFRGIAPFGPLIFNRFKRNYCVAGNILGEDGVISGATSYGNPNISNGAANGFAGPTGLSDQEGEADYSQPGYDPFEYIIQAGDISAGDFWADWEVTGTLTTRTSDVIGAFTVSGGQWTVGSVATAGGVQFPTVYWNSKANSMIQGQVTAVAGSLVTITWLSGTLPAQDTAVQMYMGAAGWQERDLDVQASTTLAHNYMAVAIGSGAVANSIAPDTLPSSLMYDAKPDWFFGLSWPPFNPNAYATADAERIPAGYRFANDGDDPPAELPGGEGLEALIVTTLTVTTLNIGA